MLEFWHSSTFLLETTDKAESLLETISVDLVLITVSFIYLVSKIGGEICVRLRLPSVLGELIAGVIIGVSGLGLLVFINGETTTIPPLIHDFLQRVYSLTEGETLQVFSFNSKVISLLSDIGVIILLFEVGLESDLNELLNVGVQALVVAIVGVVAPFLLGTLGLIYGFGVPVIPAVFAGAALTATSIGITAKVLSEIKRLNTTEGQIIIGAAVVDDILGIIILAVVASLIKTGQVEVNSVLYLSLIAVAFLVSAIVIGRFFTRFIVKVVDKMQTRGQLLVPALIFAFLLAYITHRIGLESILGSFAAGLVLAESNKGDELKRLIAPVVDIIVPIFFVCVGAKTDLRVLNPSIPSNQEGLMIALFLITVAIVGKLITSWAVWKPNLNKLGIGVGMIPRGEVGLVFAGIGSASGAVSEAIIAAIIMMVITTTFLAPIWLRSIFEKSEADQPN